MKIKIFSCVLLLCFTFTSCIVLDTTESEVVRPVSGKSSSENSDVMHQKDYLLFFGILTALIAVYFFGVKNEEKTKQNQNDKKDEKQDENVHTTNNIAEKN